MITKRQKEILDFVRKYIKKNGYAPSMNEIAKKMKISSVSTIHEHLNNIEEKGYIKREPNKNRSIVVYEREEITTPPIKNMGDKSVLVPILGSANAGVAMVFAEENIEGYLKILKSNIIKKGAIFALRVNGDSMNKAEINDKKIKDGNYVLVDSDYRVPEDGDYVLSIIDGSANIKKLKKDPESGSVRLISESTNPKHKPIFISSEDDFFVNGKIIDVIKK